MQEVTADKVLVYTKCTLVKRELIHALGTFWGLNPLDYIYIVSLEALQQPTKTSSCPPGGEAGRNEGR